MRDRGTLCCRDNYMGMQGIGRSWSGRSTYHRSRATSVTVWVLKTRFFGRCIATGGCLATKLKRAHSQPIWHLFAKFHRNRFAGLCCGASRCRHTHRDGKPDNKGTLATTQQAGRRYGWSLYNCIRVIQFLTDLVENFCQRG